MKLFSFLTNSICVFTSIIAVGTTVAAPVNDDIHCPSIEKIHKAAISLSHTKVDTNGKYDAFGFFPFYAEKNITWRLFVSNYSAQDDNDAITKGRAIAANIDTMLSDKPDEVMFKSCVYYSGQLDKKGPIVMAVGFETPNMTELFNKAIKKVKR